MPSAISVLFSATIVSLFFALGAYGSVEARWGVTFSGMREWLLAMLVWIIWFGHLEYLLWRRNFKPRNRWLLSLGLVLVSLVAGRFATEFGRLARVREIERAVGAGLREDCMHLLIHWPIKEGRIFASAPEFSELPQSIRMLGPVYVTNDKLEDLDASPNIGICKNGFGGFAAGIRVFRNDEEANKFKKRTLGGCQRVAAGVYYWWHPT